MWQKLLVGLFFIQAGIAFSGDYPEIKWHFDMNSTAFGQAAAGDIDQDGRPEIVFSTYMNDGKIYALNAEDGSLLWEYFTGSCNDAAPIIYDVDQDGKPEVVLASSCVAYTFCFNGADGSVKWKTMTGGTDSPPSVADIDNDGELEILHGNFFGKVICMGGNSGNIKWELEVDEMASIQTEPALLDMNNDGVLDFAVATWAKGERNAVYAYRGDTRELLWKFDAPNNYMYHGPAFADIDHDGKPELTIGCYNDTLYTINAEDGSPAWSYSPGGQYGYIGAPVSIGDINNDGSLELVFVSFHTLYVLKSGGELLWDYDMPFSVTSFRGAALADINADTIPDVIFGNTGGELIALNGPDGAVIWKLDLESDFGKPYDIDFAPIIGDFDGDGSLDAFIAGGHGESTDSSKNYGRCYMVSAGKGSGPDWPMFRRDRFRSGALEKDTIPNSISDRSQDFQNVPQVQIITEFEFVNKISELIELEPSKQIVIYNVLGEVISQSGKYGAKPTQIDLFSIPSGIYYVVFDNIFLIFLLIKHP